MKKVPDDIMQRFRAKVEYECKAFVDYIDDHLAMGYTCVKVDYRAEPELMWVDDKVTVSLAFKGVFPEDDEVSFKYFIKLDELMDTVWKGFYESHLKEPDSELKRLILNERKLTL